MRRSKLQLRRHFRTPVFIREGWQSRMPENPVTANALVRQPIAQRRRGVRAFSRDLPGGTDLYIGPTKRCRTPRPSGRQLAARSRRGRGSTERLRQTYRTASIECRLLPRWRVRDCLLRRRIDLFRREQNRRADARQCTRRRCRQRRCRCARVVRCVD